MSLSPSVLRAAYPVGLLAALAGQLPGQVGRDPPRRSLVVAAPIHHSDVQTREPMVVELDGSLFISGFPRLPHIPARAPSLWKSRDGGQTWRTVNVGTPATGAIGNSDVDLAVAPDGTFYFLTMGYNRSTSEGTHVSVGVSHDGGDTWVWTLLSDTPFDDRPWIAVAPNGTAHVIWNDGGGVNHAVSSDRGATWIERGRIHPAGGSSHLAVGPQGELAVRITPFSASGNRYDAGVDRLAISLDGGETWTKAAAPGNREWATSMEANPLPRWVEPVAWDANGSLYHLWSEGSTMWVGRSRDHGVSWQAWPVHEGPGVAFHPYLIARGSGELAGTWFSSSDSLRVHVALIAMAAPPSDSPPRILMADPIIPQAWTVDDEGSKTGDPAGEYVPVTFLADGDLGIVTPLQDAATDRFGFTWWRVRIR